LFSRQYKPESDTAFSILVADASNDGEMACSADHIHRTLQAALAGDSSSAKVAVRRCPATGVGKRLVRMLAGAGSGTNAEQGFLEQHEADVLISGQSAADGRQIRLDLTVLRLAPLTTDHAVSGPTISIHVPHNFGRRIGALVTALAVFMVDAPPETTRVALQSILERIVRNVGRQASACFSWREFAPTNVPVQSKGRVCAIFRERIGWNHANRLNNAILTYLHAPNCSSGASHELTDVSRNMLCALLRTSIEHETRVWQLKKAIFDDQSGQEKNSCEAGHSLRTGDLQELGLALRELGECGCGIRHIEMAARVLQVAVDACNRRRFPLRWASLKHDLGEVLLRLGERKRDRVVLQRAADHLREALDERLRERSHSDWAKSVHCVGTAYLRMGQSGGGTEPLNEAISAYRLVLSDPVCAHDPLSWAEMQHNLGTAYKLLGDRATDTSLLARALDAFNAALTERTRLSTPTDWARSQYRRAQTLQMVGERDVGTQHLEEAVNAYRLVLLEYNRIGMPLNWAKVKSDIGATLLKISERTLDTTTLADAEMAYREALEEWSNARVPNEWAQAQTRLGDILWQRAEHESDPKRAAGFFKDALSRLDVVSSVVGNS